MCEGSNCVGCDCVWGGYCVGGCLCVCRDDCVGVILCIGGLCIWIV